MKTFTKLSSFILLLFVLALTGCTEVLFSSENGSGNIVIQKRNITDFTKVVIQGSGNLYVSQGNSEEVKIETDDNIQPLITTKNDHGMLIIGSEKSIRPKKLNIYVTMKDIHGLKLEGSGNITNQTAINTKDLAMEIDGSGNIKMKDINAAEINIEISGSGNADITGKTTKLNTEIAGSGNVETYNLPSETANISINGSGDCKVNVTGKLMVSINGSGSIYYKGKPKDIVKDINGSGRLKQMD